METVALLEQIDTIPPLVTKEVKRKFRDDGVMIDGQERMVRQIIRELAQTEERKRLVVFITGMPGSGKSRLAKATRTRIVKSEILGPDQVKVISLDSFIGTERGTPERSALKTGDARYFGQHYIRYAYAREKIQEVLEKMNEGKGGTIQVAKEYYRNPDDPERDGRFIDNIWEISPRTRLLLVEGSGANGEISPIVQEFENIALMRISTHVKIFQSLMNATVRDMCRSKEAVNGTSVLEHRIGEYRHLVNMLQPCVAASDMLYRRFPTDDAFVDTIDRKVRKGLTQGDHVSTALSTFFKSFPPKWLACTLGPGANIDTVFQTLAA